MFTASHFEEDGALCLAKLRPEGFCSLEAGMQGTLLTKPFLWARGKALYLNCDARYGEPRPAAPEVFVSAPKISFPREPLI